MRSYVSLKCNVWGVQIGDKKQGLPPTVGKNRLASDSSKKAIGNKRDWVFSNGGALSGVGAGASAFPSQGNNWTSAGGMHKIRAYKYNRPSFNPEGLPRN